MTSCAFTCRRFPVSQTVPYAVLFLFLFRSSLKELPQRECQRADYKRHKPICKERVAQQGLRDNMDKMLSAESQGSRLRNLETRNRDLRAWSLVHVAYTLCAAVWHGLDIFSNPDARFDRVLLLRVTRREKEVKAERLYTVDDATVYKHSELPEDIAATLREHQIRGEKQAKEKGWLGATVVMVCEKPTMLKAVNDTVSFGLPLLSCAC